MGKEDAKKSHKSGKVSVEECARSNIKNIESGKSRIVTCSNCKLAGHNSLKCKLPKCRNRSDVDLVDFDVSDFDVRSPPKKQKLDLVSADDWI